MLLMGGGGSWSMLFVVGGGERWVWVVYYNTKGPHSEWRSKVIFCLGNVHQKSRNWKPWSTGRIYSYSLVCLSFMRSKPLLAGTRGEKTTKRFLYLLREISVDVVPTSHPNEPPEHQHGEISFLSYVYCTTPYAR